MKITNDRMRDALCAEYVLGTLRGPARRRFMRLLQHDVGLRQRVAFWEETLVSFARGTAPVSPSPQSWAAISRRLGLAEPRTQSRFRPIGPLRYWLAAVAVVLAVGLSMLSPLRERFMFEPDVRVAITDDARQALWIIEADRNRNRLRVRTLRDIPVAQDKSLELWLLLADGSAPVSLGLMPQTQGAELELQPRADLRAGNGFAVSLEPRGGSPTGRATGPILHVQTFGQTT
ncbi:Anti-sigma-K factor RskA [Fontimonas thermophila]|uniref:Anti-sigma-K factor RskA n=1 Tax=Fontimonas thermophila TaxID=1076937 RepID=A0A1I2IF46_9GAMM|nr:anti-sigma factor [Fontimonas thermophila]SFF39456.1 Anti-sigma-K factor RskA [Fontimonas thermophila]